MHARTGRTDVAVEKHAGPGVVSLTVNGESFSGMAEPRMLLSDFLRHSLGLTGTHVGCEQGVCGACTVLVDGEPTRSCLTFAVQVQDSDVETVEGLADNGTLDPIQEAYRTEHGLQCGFCTPGFLMATKALLEENAAPTVPEIREYMSGNVCRCTGYQGIVAAVLKAAEVRRSVSDDD
jgi:aerobic-type carbon monoxide dehydrogenase small subunit (CoxS/CutS family)